jgi:hypothetical protein
MPNYVKCWLLFASGALAVAGCATTPSEPPTAVPSLRQRNQGYALVYKLMSDESDVSKLLIIKHVDEPIGTLIKEISAAAKAAKKEMDEFPKSDVVISYNDDGLPNVETESRKLTSKHDAKTLLTSSGKSFELELVFTQTQAMGHAADLTAALESHEENPGRRAFLANLSKQCEGFHDRLMNLLTVK